MTRALLILLVLAGCPTPKSVSLMSPSCDGHVTVSPKGT